MRKHVLKVNSIMLLTLLCSLFSINAFGQNGTISGTIVGASGPLPAATIGIENTSIGTITDFNGEFFLTNVPEGEVTLVINLLGYETFKKPVNVTSSEKTSLGLIKLEEKAFQHEEITVFGQDLRESQQRAFAIQKASPRVVSVLAADKIGKLPDKNAAEAVARIPGVTIERDQGEGRFVIVRGAPTWWNSMTLNGERIPTSGFGEGEGRDVPLDILPSEFISYIEVSKTLTPDQEADAIGGSVNFITPTAPNRQKFEIKTGSGYHNQSQDLISDFSFVYGDRFEKFGFMVTGSWYSRNWGSDNYELIYNNNLTYDARANGDLAKDEAYATELQLRDYIGNRTTWGTNAAMEYKLDDNNLIFSRAIFSDYVDDEIRRRTKYDFDSDRIDKDLTHTLYHTQIYGGEVGGNHQTGSGIEFDWKYNFYSNSNGYLSPNQNAINDRTAGYTYVRWRDSGINYGGLDPTYGKYKIISPSNYENVQPRPGITESLDRYQFQFVSSSGSITTETDHVLQANLTLPVSSQQKVKFGSKVRFKKHDVFRKYALWTTSNTLTLNEWAEYEFPFNGGFLTEIGEPYKNLLLTHMDPNLAWEIIDIDGMSRSINLRKDVNYTGYENFYAGYLMTTYKFSDQLSVVPGVRFEYVDLEYNAFLEDENGEFKPTKETSDYSNILPMITFKYTPLDQFNLKLAVTRAIARPAFDRLSPSANENYVDLTVTKGNTQLKPTKTWNFDILGEYFFEDVGLAQAGVFYKTIDDYIFETTKSEDYLGDGQIWQVTEPRNAESGYLWGFELALHKRLSFLPGALNGLGIGINYTYSDSKIDQPRTNRAGNDTTFSQRLPNQPKNVLNLSLLYEKYGFSFTAALHFKDAYVHKVQGPSPDYDRWYDSNTQLDISTAYNFSPQLKTYLEFKNLLNSPLRYYNGSDNLPEEAEYYSFQVLLGIRYSVL